MIIKDIIALAKYSEMSGVAVKNDLDAIVAFINLGMLELHTRFPIKIEEYVVELQTGVSFYPMPDNFMYATSAYGEVDRYSPGENKPLAINDDTDPYSVFFSSWDMLQVTEAVTGGFVSVIYVAKPVRITKELAEDGSSELDLPDSLVDCLLSYLGYRAHLGVKSDSQSENNTHLQRFERNCKKALELGVAFPSDSMHMEERVASRGFA